MNSKKVEMFLIMVILFGIITSNKELNADEKITLSNPIILVDPILHSFDEVYPVFKVDIIPYQDNGNVIKGFVYNKGDETGSPVAEVTFETADTNTPQDGESRAYIGKVNKQLLAGNGIARQYTIKLKHELMGKSGDNTATLNVYPTISEDEVKKLGIQFQAFGTYGNDFFFNFTPPSGRNVAPDQFGYYFKTDGDAQDRGLVPGLKAERSDKLSFPANAKEASLKIVWIDPITKNEVAVFPEKTIQIKQTAPSISTNFASESIAGDDVISCRISNLKLQAPFIGDGKFATVDFTAEVDQVQIKQNYIIVGKPTVTRDDESVTIDFKIQGEPNEDGWAKGNVILKLVAIASNPGNGVKSEPVRKTYSFKVNKKIEEVKIDIVKDTLYENVSLIMNKFPKNKKIEIYQIFNIEQIKEILLDNNSGKEDTEFKDSEVILGQVPDEIKRLIEEGVFGEKTLTAVQQDIIMQGYDLPEEDIFKPVYDYYNSILLRNKSLNNHTLIYVLTTDTSNNNKSPKELIGLIIVELPIEDVSSNIDTNIKYLNNSNIKDTNELKNIKVDKNIYRYNNLFELINSNLNDGTVILRKVIEK